MGMAQSGKAHIACKRYGGCKRYGCCKRYDCLEGRAPYRPADTAQATIIAGGDGPHAVIENFTTIKRGLNRRKVCQF